MADNIIAITFNNDKITSNDTADAIYLDGTLYVDYASNNVSGSLDVTGAIDANLSSFLLRDSKGTIVIFSNTDGNAQLDIRYSDSNQSPSTVLATYADFSKDFTWYNPSAPVSSAAYTPDTPCYVTGTQILTSRGEVAVEALAVGDLVVTASGEHRPIRWIGHRTINPRRAAKPAEAQPVRIRAHALGPNRPARDLVVSPGHAICLDLLGEILVPASSLINGTTIAQEDVDSVTYWHVELDRHDVLIAEGQPAESYLDMGNRAFFARSSGIHAIIDLTASPDGDPAQRTHADFCRPFHGQGPLVEAARSQIRVRAEAQGWQLIERQPWAGVHLEVDGQVVHPEAKGSNARFTLPSDAKEVVLVCPTSVPAHVKGSGDRRALGLCLSALSLESASDTPLIIALDDARLNEGLHKNEGSHRWTSARARIPVDLWEGLDGPVTLCLTLSAGPLPFWQAPVEQAKPEARSIAA